MRFDHCPHGADDPRYNIRRRAMPDNYIHRASRVGALSRSRVYHEVDAAEARAYARALYRDRKRGR